MTDKQISAYCDDVKETALKQFYKIQNQRKEISILHKKCVRQQAEIEELTHKLECLLCHATGSKLSKSTYSLRTMEIAVNDEVQQCCEEAQAEAIKEFAEKVDEILKRYAHLHKYAEKARHSTEEYADGTPMEMVSVWEVRILVRFVYYY